MTNSSRPSKLIRAIVQGVIAGGLVGWIVLIFWIEEIAFASPVHPDPLTGATTSFSFKGVVHYVQPWKAPLLTHGPWATWLLWVIFSLTVGRWAFPEWNRPTR